MLSALILLVGCSDDDAPLADGGASDALPGDAGSADVDMRDASTNTDAGPADAALPPTGECESFGVAMMGGPGTAAALSISEEGEVFVTGMATAGARFGSRTANQSGHFVAMVDR